MKKRYWAWPRTPWGLSVTGPASPNGHQNTLCDWPRDSGGCHDRRQLADPNGIQARVTAQEPELSAPTQGIARQLASAAPSHEMFGGVAVKGIARFAAVESGLHLGYIEPLDLPLLPPVMMMVGAPVVDANFIIAEKRGVADLEHITIPPAVPGREVSLPVRTTRGLRRT